MKKDNKKGYLLPMVIIYMIITMIVGAGILVLGSLDRIETNKRLHREQAFYLAEAGINLAYFNLKNSSSWQPTNPYSLGIGNFQLVVDNTTSNTMITVTSTGKISGVNDEIIVVNLTKGGGSKIFGRGLFGTLGVIMQENAYIDSYDSRVFPVVYGNSGNVESNTTITLDNNAEIHGAALSHGGPGTIIVKNQWVITGGRTEDTTPRILNPVPVVIPNYPGFSSPVPGPTDFRINGGILDNSIYTLTGGVLTVKKGNTLNISGGDFQFKSITLGGGPATTLNFTGTVRIYVTDSLTTGNNSTINFQSPSQNELWMGNSPGQIAMDNNSTMSTPTPGSALGIYVAGNADQELANNAASPFYAVIYAPLAQVTLLNNSELWGNIVANKIIMEQRSTVHYNVALESTLPPGDPGGSSAPTFINWTKPFWNIK